MWSGRDFVSTIAWSLVEKPPRECPIALLWIFFFRPTHPDVRGPRCQSGPLLVGQRVPVHDLEQTDRTGDRTIDNLSRYRWDDQGRMIEHAYYAGSTLEFLTTISHDPDGETSIAATYWDGDGVGEEARYRNIRDAAGRLILEEADQENDGAVDTRATYTWNGEQLTSVLREDLRDGDPDILSTSAVSEHAC